MATQGLSAFLLMASFAVLVLIPGCTPGGTIDNEGAVAPTSTAITILEEPTQISGPSSPSQPEPTIAPTPPQEPGFGELLWTFKPGPAGEPPFWVSPLTSATAMDGVIYAGASDLPGGKRGSLQALDAGDGSLLWSFDHNGHTPSTPTVADEVVYFGSEDHNVYAVDALEGLMLWAYTTGGHVRSKPAVFEGMVFVNSQDGYLYVLDAKSGMLRWRFQFGEPVSDIASIGSVPSSPAVGNGAVFIVGNDHILRAINILDGTLRWQYEVGGQVFGSPTAAEGVIYAGSLNRRLLALNSADGSLLWSYRAEGAILSTPVVEAGKIYVSSSIVSALEALNGMVIWEYDPQLVGTLGSPAVEDQGLYFASSDGQLFVLDKNDGMLLATYELGENIGAKAPAVANGVMYVVAKDRSLYAVKMAASNGE